MNGTTDVKERNHLDYICPWMMVGSKICPMGLCRFWSQELKDCRWSIWLEQQLLKTDLTLSQLCQEVEKNQSKIDKLKQEEKNGRK